MEEKHFKNCHTKKINENNEPPPLLSRRSSAHFDQEVFRRSKDSDADETASLKKFLDDLQSCGILQDDPRLRPILKELMVKNPTIVEDTRLNFHEFSSIVRKSKMFISYVLEGNVVIPEFQTFCKSLEEIYNYCKDNSEGTPAQYIPQLAGVDSNKWGVACCSVDGQRFSVGDAKEMFTIQSTSKPFTYGLCLEHLGDVEVEKFIGWEPSGQVFNSVGLDVHGHPHNPMINSGAIMSAALLLYKLEAKQSIAQKFEMIQKYFSKLSGGSYVGFQNSVFLSERETADRNFALAYFMRENKCFPSSACDNRTVLDFYLQICSLEMNCESMSVMAATLANGGICPTTGERVLGKTSVKNILSMMYSSGMYNNSGQFAFQVGLPAKSGVSGVIITVVPGLAGFATWSPPLDSAGNSVRGVSFCKHLVRTYDLHIFDSYAPHSASHNLREDKYEKKCLQILKLMLAASQGDKQALERAYISGMDMEAVDYDNRTALHLACSEGHLECVRFLVDVCKVDTNIVDRSGMSSLDEAYKLKDEKIIEVLQNKSKKINKNLKDLDEKTGERFELLDTIQEATLDRNR